MRTQFVFGDEVGGFVTVPVIPRVVLAVMTITVTAMLALTVARPTKIVG